MATRNLSIMFTDIKGFTARTSGDTRQGMTQFLSLHEKLLVPVFQYFKGTIVKTIGDAFLVYFESPTDAVLCGVTIQEVLRQHNADCVEEEKLDVRVAINVGDVELQDNDVLGEAVNIAARVEGIAEAGEVFFTEAVYQTMNRKEAPSSEIGERIFKGIPHPIRVYKVIHDPNSDLAQSLTAHVNLSDSGPVIKGFRHEEPTTTSKNISATILVCMVVLLVLGFALWQIIPSANERTINQAQELIEQQKFGAALTVLDPALRAHPMDPELLIQAQQAGHSYLQTFIKAEQYQQGLTWLTAELLKNPYLESLRPELAILDTRATILGLKSQPDYANHYYPQPLKELLVKYPNNVDVRYIGGKVLEIHWFSKTALWYFNEALKLGKAPDEHILNFCTKRLTTHGSGYPEQQLARNILHTYYPERELAWAKDAMTKTNVQAIRNGWIILTEAKEPLAEVPYYQTIFKLVKNTSDFDDELYTFFAKEENPARRTQIIEIHEILVTTYPRFINYGNRQKALSDNLRKLQDKWKKE